MAHFVNISKGEYIGLLIDQERLNRLECGGVRHWRGFDDAIWNDDLKDFDDFIKDTRTQVNEM